MQPADSNEFVSLYDAYIPPKNYLGRGFVVERRGDNECFVYIPVGGPALAAEQIRIIDDLDIEMTPLPGDNLHITLIWSEDCDEELIGQMLTSIAPPIHFNIEVASLGILEGGDAPALVWLVNPSPGLMRLQSDLARAAERAGIPLSIFSDPLIYTPHISLAYGLAEKPETLPQIQPFSLYINHFLVGRDEFETMFTVYLPRGMGDRVLVEQSLERRHASPIHPGTGSDQQVHAGNGGGGDGEEWKVKEGGYAEWSETDDLVKIYSDNEDGTFDIEVVSGPARGESHKNVYADDLLEYDQDVLDLWTEEGIDATLARAKEIFGLTDDFAEAGYILDTGEMLDFSGKNQGGSPGTRAFDHRDIGQALLDHEPGGTEGMVKFMDDANAIRLIVGQGDLSVDFAGPPTRDQREQIMSIALRSDNIYWDVTRWNDEKKSFSTIDSGSVTPDYEEIEEMLGRIRGIYYRQRSWLIRALNELRNLVLRGGPDSGYHDPHKGRPGRIGGFDPRSGEKGAGQAGGKDTVKGGGESGKFRREQQSEADKWASTGSDMTKKPIRVTEAELLSILRDEPVVRGLFRRVLTLADGPFTVIRSPHSRTRCMECRKKPTVAVHWADGRGMAWFCLADFKKWAKEDDRDIVGVWHLENGECPKDITKTPAGTEKVRKLGQDASLNEILSRLQKITTRADAEPDYGKDSIGDIALKPKQPDFDRKKGRFEKDNHRPFASVEVVPFLNRYPELKDALPEWSYPASDVLDEVLREVHRREETTEVAIADKLGELWLKSGSYLDIPVPPIQLVQLGNLGIEELMRELALAQIGSVVSKHASPIHPGTGTDQSVHAGKGGGKGGEKAKLKLPSKIEFDPDLTSEARFQGHQDRIAVGPKFAELPSDEARRAVIAHEIGHRISDEMLEDESAWKLHDEGAFVGDFDGRKVDGISGATTPGENIAEAYATFLEEPEWLKEHYPAAYEGIEEAISRYDFPSTLEDALRPYSDVLKEHGIASAGSAKSPAIPRPLSDNFSYRQSKVSGHFDQAIGDMDKVFIGNEDLDIKLSGYSGRGEGKYDDDAGKIKINNSPQHPELSFVHEMGHAMDHRVLPDALGIEGKTAALGSIVDNTPMDGFWEAIDNSSAIKELQTMKLDDPSGIEYLLDVREVHARAFSQYVAEKSGSRVLLGQLDEVREMTWYPEQWSKEDFAPISKALDKLYGDAELLKR